MSPPPASPSTTPRGLAHRLLADARGVTAVEFGIVCAPFLALLGAIVQIALMAWAQENLDFTFQQAARGLFTGKFQLSNAQSSDAATLLTALRKTMCGSGSSNPSTVYSCPGVKLDVRLGTNFASAAPIAPVNGATRTWSSSFGTNYSCAAPGSIVIATAAVEFPIFFGLWNAGLTTFADGGTLLQSTAVFRTEPYASGASPC